MNRSKVRWGILAAVIACIGCCTIPLFSLVAIASSFAVLGSFAKNSGIDILLCLIPLVMILIAYIGHHKRHLKKCCPTPQSGCDNKKCSTEPQEK
ncbi:MAG: hypothetical protein V4660_07185 [Pseudomonadota bacterium]